MAGTSATVGALSWFDDMIRHSHDFAAAEKAKGRPIVGILCEFTPRELILAAGCVPVLLCGGSASTIPAAEQFLPSNLCPLIKSTFGYHVQGANPFLEMADLVVGETTCDGKKKMFELLAERRPVHVLALPHRQDDPDALEQWARELRRFRTELGRRFDVAISDAAIRDAIAAMNRERGLRRQLAELMKADPPPLTGRMLLALRAIVSGMPALRDALEQAHAALSARTPRADLAGRTRVLLTGVPVPHGAERVVDLIEGHGGLVVAQENCTGLKPILDDVDPADPDPVRALARKYFQLPCSVMTRNDRRLESLRRLAAEYRPHCVIDLVWQACLTYDVEAYRVRRLAEEELGLPYLRIETDYAPSDTARIVVRVEALFERVRAAGRS